jgi:hypothetical protein
MNLKNTKKLYQFNFEGKLIKQFTNIDEAVIFLNKPKLSIFQTIRRESIVNQSYYLSFDIDFSIPKKRANFNPLLSKSNRPLR